MPFIDTSLLPQGSGFIVRLEPVGGWPDSEEGFYVPAQAHIAEALAARFGAPFAVTSVDSEQQFTDYHIAKQDQALGANHGQPLSGYHIAKAISGTFEWELFRRPGEMPDIDVRILLPEQPRDLVGYSEARHQQRQPGQRV